MSTSCSARSTWCRFRRYLVPIPPLDGSRVLAGMLPDRVGQTMAQIEPYGLIILVFLLVSGVLNLMPVVSGVSHFILSLFF